MTSLSLLRAPRRHRSGDDAFSPAFAAAMGRHFSPVSLADIWPDWHDTVLSSFPLRFVPLRHRVYRATVLPAVVGRVVGRLPSGGVTCVRGEMLMGDASAVYERRIKSRGRYVYNLIDDWFAVPTLATRASARCDLADLIVVPTTRLQEVCAARHPRATVACIEEPVDASRFDVASAGAAGETAERKSETPLLVWAGNPFSQRELFELADVLAAVHAVRPFSLVVISGQQRPALPLSIPWEWRPWSPIVEQEVIPRAWAGLCHLGADAFSAAKGCYKVKTYMAAGTVPVVSDVGHARTVLTAAAAGTLVPGNEPARWREALLAALASREDAVREGDRVRAYAREAFAFDHVAACWAEWLERLQ